VVTDLVKRFDGASPPVLDRTSFEVVPGSLTCLLGPSGTGKTTLLHIIAGLVTADSGSIHLDGVPLDEVPTHRRPLTLLMQQPQLFAHLDVIDNVGFGLRVRGVNRRRRRHEAAELLDLVGIAHLATRRVHHLSGGEQQRIALARALAVRPQVLLADEPFASVDTDVRHELQLLIRDVQTRTGTTIVMVTHDQDEARRIATHRLFLRDGIVGSEPAASRHVRYGESSPDCGATGNACADAPAPLIAEAPKLGRCSIRLERVDGLS
jgi:putative spermidine/putrescine transport system ATP-binding protein